VLTLRFTFCTWFVVLFIVIGFEVCNDALQMLGGYGYLKVGV
jgi:hypothetical protein